MTSSEINNEVKKVPAGGSSDQATCHADIVDAPTSEPCGATFFMDASMGWVKLYRKFIGWEWYTDSNVKSVFLHILLNANTVDKNWRGVKIDRGQYVTSIGKLAIELGLTPKAVRVSLNKLKTTGEIALKGANKFTMITICNYDTYQTRNKVEGQTTGQTEGNEGANKGQQLKNNKNIIIEEDKSENPVFGKSIVIKNAHDLFNEMMNAFTRRDQILKSTFAEKMKYTEYMLNKDIKEFIEEQRIADAFPKTLNEYFRHFFAWAKKKHKYNA